MKSRLSKLSRVSLKVLVRRVFLAALFLGVGGVQSAYAGLTVTPVSWNVVGLDSNNPTVGPDTFQVGARVCNTGGTAVNSIVGDFIWDSTNAFINLSGASTLNLSSLNAGACTDFYYPVTITRSSLAYNATRSYHIAVSATGISTITTPTPREIYVEKIISQNRNSVNSIVGPTTVFVGQTYNYTVNASTATQGYEQLEAFLNLPNIIFQVLAISTTYSSPAGATNDKFYADACGWDNNPLSANYRSCIGPQNYVGGKAGADLTYTIAFTNTGTAGASSLIVTDPIPGNTDFKIGSVTSSLGTTGLTVSVAYSNDNGSTWTYTPVSGGGGALSGYDRNVTNIKWTFTGNLSQTSPNNTGNVGFTSRIR